MRPFLYNRRSLNENKKDYLKTTWFNDSLDTDFLIPNRWGVASKL